MHVPSAKSAEFWGCKFVHEYADDVNEITKVDCITREEWEHNLSMQLKVYIYRRKIFSMKEKLCLKGFQH